MRIKTVADINVSGKKVLMRVDFNCPIENGRVTNDRRIVQAIPTIKYCLDHGATLILMTHLGRPSGKGFEAEFSTKPTAERLSEILGVPVRLGPEEVVGQRTKEMVDAMKQGDVILLENLRFNPGETISDKAKKNPDKKLTPEQEDIQNRFVNALAELGEVYVNDAFGTCHRKHASMYGVPIKIREKGGPAVAGFLVEKEIRYLHDAVDNPKRPFIAILGGAKVSDKIKLISNLSKKVDNILIGGAMAYTLLKARGVNVGKSKVEEEFVDEMKGLLESLKDKILLPIDHVATDDFENGKPVFVEEENIPENLLGMDIGKRTIEMFRALIGRAQTIVWNGPMGVFERPDYAQGTRAIAEALSQATKSGAVTIVGGGDSAAAVEEMGFGEAITHISTGGGASLEFLEGRPMPPIEILDKIED